MYGVQINRVLTAHSVRRNHWNWTYAICLSFRSFVPTPFLKLFVCQTALWRYHNMLYFSDQISDNASFGFYVDMIWYLCNRNWVDTRWQHHTTHLQQTIHTIHREYNSGSEGRAPSLRVIPWHLPYSWGKSTEKTSVRVAQYKNNEQAQRTNTIQEQQQAPHKDRSTIQEHEPSQYKINEQAPEPWNTIP